jgi:hypothetical protein
MGFPSIEAVVGDQPAAVAVIGEHGFHRWSARAVIARVVVLDEVTYRHHVHGAHCSA